MHTRAPEQEKVLCEYGGEHDKEAPEKGERKSQAVEMRLAGKLCKGQQTKEDEHRTLAGRK